MPCAHPLDAALLDGAVRIACARIASIHAGARVLALAHHCTSMKRRVAPLGSITVHIGTRGGVIGTSRCDGTRTRNASRRAVPALLVHKNHSPVTSLFPFGNFA